jgi:(p)ppGpp synthase/HD superfamily hydrolase
MTPWNADLFEELSLFAAEHHRNQVVPNGKGLPYYLHLTQVCNRAMRAAAERTELDVDLIMACAILHDVIEDCATTPQLHEKISNEIRRKFGELVLNGVLALSKREIVDVSGNRDKAAMMRDSLDRILLQGHEVWVVKLADRICNLQPPPPHWKDEKKRAYLVEAQEIHAALHPASPILANELLQRIIRYESFIKIIE